MQVSGDPVTLGLVQNFARPGGNITGFVQSPQALWGKRLDLLTDLLGRPPRRLAFLANPRTTAANAFWKEVREEAGKIAADVELVDVGAPADLERLFENIKDCDALLVPADLLLGSLRNEIADLAIRHRLPAIYEQRRNVEVGARCPMGLI